MAGDATPPTFRRPPGTRWQYIPAMTAFHSATFRLLQREPRASAAAGAAVDAAEQRLGIRLPASVREWYRNEDAIDILAAHSNQDPPIAVERFVAIESDGRPLLPFRHENQGVCTWAIALDGSDDPPVYVDVDSDGKKWNFLAPTFSAYVYTSVWDYAVVLNRPVVVQAQNEPLSETALTELRRCFREEQPTFGGLSSTQHRFTGNECGILIWNAVGQQADWFAGAADAHRLESAVRTIWQLDDVGRSLYASDESGESVLRRVRGRA